MDLSDELFKALGRLAERDPDNDQEFIDRAARRLEDMDTHERIAFEMSRFLTREAVIHNDKRLHYAAMAALCLSGILDEEPGLSDLSLLGYMDFADQGWPEIENAVSSAIASMWTEEDSK